MSASAWTAAGSRRRSSPPVSGWTGRLPERRGDGGEQSDRDRPGQRGGPDLAACSGHMGAKDEPLCRADGHQQYQPADPDDRDENAGWPGAQIGADGAGGETDRPCQGGGACGRGCPSGTTTAGAVRGGARAPETSPTPRLRAPASNSEGIVTAAVAWAVMAPIMAGAANPSHSPRVTELNQDSQSVRLRAAGRASVSRVIMTTGSSVSAGTRGWVVRLALLPGRGARSAARFRCRRAIDRRATRRPVVVWRSCAPVLGVAVAGEDADLDVGAGVLDRQGDRLAGRAGHETQRAHLAAEQPSDRRPECREDDAVRVDANPATSTVDGWCVMVGSPWLSRVNVSAVRMPGRRDPNRFR